MLRRIKIWLWRRPTTRWPLLLARSPKGECFPSFLTSPHMDLCVHACTLSLLRSIQLSNPRDCSPPGSSVHGILLAGILEWASVPSSRGSSHPRDGTHIALCLPALVGRFFTTSIRRAWQPTPVFLPGEFHGQRRPGGLQSMGSQRVEHNWVTKHCITTSTTWEDHALMEYPLFTRLYSELWCRTVNKINKTPSSPGAHIPVRKTKNK